MSTEKPEPSRAELLDQIKAFDSWFRYAETIGQNRLYNFLMASSIIFVGCAALISIKHSFICHLVALVLVILGFQISSMWFFLGKRQSKFHVMLETSIDNLCKDYGEGLPKLPIRTINDMKSHTHVISNINFYLFLQVPWRFIKSSLSEKLQQDNTTLNQNEVIISNRLLFTEIPKVFGFAFALIAVMLCGQIFLDFWPARK